MKKLLVLMLLGSLAMFQQAQARILIGTWLLPKEVFLPM